ncbi:retrovirus-related pol polyprotein from transposon TNT 1-94 [Tanacetum coccineum]
MLSPNSSLSYNGKPFFVNSKYLKKAQSKKPCLYKIPYDKDDLANIFAPDSDETLTLEQESRSNLDKEKIKKYDYTYQNSLYEIFTPQTPESLDQLYYANETQMKIWRKSFVKYKPIIVKKSVFLPTQASLSKSRHAFNVVLHNITNFKQIVDLDWEKRMDNRWQQPITHEINVLVKNLLIPLAIKTKANANEIERALKQEMFEDLEYCVSKDIMCSVLHSLADIDEQTELQCLHLEKKEECERLKIELSKQTENKVQLQDKKIAISKLKKLIEKMKGKSVATKFEEPSVVQQPNALEIPKPSILGKPTPFSDSLERKKISKTKSVTKTNVSERVIHKTSVSRPQLRGTQRKEKVMQNQSQVKLKQMEVEDQHMNFSFSNKTKSITAYNDNLKSRTSNVNDVCVTYGKRNVTIKRVYYVEGLNHNLFSIGQLCDADLEVAFRKSTCFVRDLQENDLLTGNCRSNLYTISLQETSSPTLICFMEKASPTQAWLWHRLHSYLNFDTINLLSKKDIVNGLPKLKYVKNQLCSSYELGKAKRSTFKTKTVLSSKGWLNLLHIYVFLCGLKASMTGNTFW